MNSEGKGHKVIQFISFIKKKINPAEILVTIFLSQKKHAL